MWLPMSKLLCASRPWRSRGETSLRPAERVFILDVGTSAMPQAARFPN